MSTIAFGCAAEPTAAWVRRVELLAWSLRTFGGACAGAEFHACFAGDVDECLVAPLAELDVTVHRVARFDDRLSYANKLRLLELGDDLGPDVEAVAMVDCDIVVTGDPGPLLPSTHVAAKPADRDPLDVAGWRRLCAALGLPVPPADVVASATGRPMPRYYNSGVVVVPRDAQASMQEAWARWLRTVVDVLSEQPDVVPQGRRIFADQYALMAAMAEHDGRPLPTAANCPTHLKLAPAARPATTPALLHYHARIWPDGFLQQPAEPAIREAAARFNARRAEALGLPDPGLRPPPARDRLRAARADVEDVVRASRSFTRVRTAVAGSRSTRVA
ncbi:MAG: hypothetical protein ACEQSX_01940 [Baekduiaceae bacterium]